VYTIPVYDALIHELSNAVSKLLSDISMYEEVVRYVRDVNIYPVGSGRDVNIPDVIASDSSRVLRKFSLAMIYAVQAVSIKASLRSSSDSKLVVRSKAGYYIPSGAEVVPDELLVRIVQLLSKVLEVEGTLEVLEGSSAIVLFDGSLISFLWGYSERGLPRGFYPSTYKSLRDLWNNILRGITEVRKYSVPLFIAKTVKRSYYVDSLLPKDLSKGVNDLILIKALASLGKLPREPYVLEPMYVDRESLPEPLNRLDVDLTPLTPMTVTYVSFGYGSPPYQVSMPGRVCVDELVNIITSIHPYSYNGYPDPLKVAHNRCKLSNMEFRHLLYKLGLHSIPTGRELLGEFL